MQVKTSLRFYSESHAVHWEVERHFGDRLPPEWEHLVSMACFPGSAAVGLMGKPRAPAPDERDFFDQEMSFFRACFARSPDLALEVLSYARRCLARYNKANGNQTERVQAFLLKHPGAADLLQDKEIAARVFGPKSRAVEAVKHARQSMSWKVKKIDRTPQELATLRQQIRTELREAGLPAELEDTIFKQEQNGCFFFDTKGKKSP